MIAYYGTLHFAWSDMWRVLTSALGYWPEAIKIKIIAMTDS